MNRRIKMLSMQYMCKQDFARIRCTLVLSTLFLACYHFYLECARLLVSFAFQLFLAVQISPLCYFILQTGIFCQHTIVMYCHYYKQQHKQFYVLLVIYGQQLMNQKSCIFTGKMLISALQNKVDKCYQTGSNLFENSTRVITA